MNVNAHKFIKNFSYTITTNIITVLISGLVIFMVPERIGATNYGYWHLYILYASYVSLFNFGWCEGIYLRYGGKDYHELNKDLMHSQFIMLFLFQVLIAFFIVLFSFTVEDAEKSYIYKMIAFTIILTNMKSMLAYVLQISYRIKEYSRVLLSDRVSYFIAVCVCLLAGVRSYRPLIIADIFGRMIALIIAMLYCRDITLKMKCVPDWLETKRNVFVGSKFMISNILNTLLSTMCRIAIETRWGVATFGKVSLSISISSLMLVFINAIGTILFPVIKRVDHEKLADLYTMTRHILTSLLYGILLFYYPFIALVNRFFPVYFPQYVESMVFMTLVFPLFMYEGKGGTLVNAYMKALRQEKMMLAITFVSLIFGFSYIFICTVLMENLYASVLGILITLIVRCELTEFVVCRTMNIPKAKKISVDLLFTLLFFLTAAIPSVFIGAFLYLTAYLSYLVIIRKSLLSSIIMFKQLVK